MSNFDPVVDAGSSLISRISKAVAAAVSGGLTTAGAALAAGADPLQAAISGVVGILAGLGVTYTAPANRQ